MLLLPHELEKPFVDAPVVGQLGMERGEQEPPVPHEHRVALELAEHLDLVTERADARSPDEDATERHRVLRELDVGLEAPHLAAVGVPFDPEIRDAEMVAVEEDHSRARP